jgi:putative flippase GtrA
VTAIFQRFEAMWSEGVLGQVVRFGISGGIATLVYAIVYSPLAKYQVVTPSIANLAGYAAAMITGYFLHSRWSFRGHGERDNFARTGGRFFVVSLVSLAMNSFFVWVLTEDSMFNGPWWWPLIPIVFVTPLATFALNRLWVFG